MDEDFKLIGDDRPVALADSGIVLVAPGLTGSGTCFEARAIHGLRAATSERAGLDRALAEAELQDRFTLVVEAETPTAPAAGGRSASALRDDQMQLDIPDRPDEGQFLIYQDEAGRVSLHTVEPSAPSAALRGAAPLRRYLLPLRVASAPSGGPGTRGFFGQIGRKILKVVVWKLVDAAAGALAVYAVQRWERRHRAFEGLVQGNAATLFGATPAPMSDVGGLKGKKSLLFLHGTTSSSRGAFGSLAQEPKLVADLCSAYGDRVIGFEHRTLTRRVMDNARMLAARLAADPGDYVFDVVAHSRGGLVARAVETLGSSLPPGLRIRFEKVVYVGTPNAGTVLADPSNISGWIDRAANLADLLPDACGGFVLSALLSVAATVVEHGLEAVPGLADQAPRSELLQSLPAAGAGRYAAQADFHATGSAAGVVADHLIDGLFSGAANDLVVPTQGVSTFADAALPAAQVKAFSGAAVHHTSFFDSPDFRAWLRSVLLGGGAANLLTPPLPAS